MTDGPEPAARLREAAQSALDLKASGRRALMESLSVRYGIPKGGFRYLRHGLFVKNGDVRLVWLMRDLLDERRSNAAAANMQRTSDLVPEIPASLVLVTTDRESHPAVHSRSGRLVETFYEGGLDHIWESKDRLGLPSEITRQWRELPPYESLESDSHKMVHPGFLPESHLIIGYAAQTRLSFRDFEAAVIKSLGEAEGREALATMSDEARSVWQAFAFATPGGVRFQASARGQFSRKEFGAQSALGYLVYKARQEGRPVSLNEILTDRFLNQSNHVKKAKVRAVEAAFVDQLLPPIAPGPAKPRIPRLIPHGRIGEPPPAPTTPGILGFVANVLGLQPDAEPHYIGKGRTLQRLTREPDVSLGLTYTVGRGETVSSIARKYDTTVDAIGKANPWLYGREARTRSGRVLRDLDLIRAGEQIDIPGSPPEHGAGDGEFTVATSNVSLGLSHTVARGETISGIARRYGTTADAIGKANPWLFGREAHTRSGRTLRDLDCVRHGETLILPGAPAWTHGAAVRGAGRGASAAAVSLNLTHTVGAGETISGIARRYGTTVDAIGKANPWLYGREATTRSGRVLRGLDYVRRGETLILAGPAPGARGPSTDGVGFMPGTDKLSLGLSHTVARGETISSIARRYGTTVDAIGKANPWLYGREATARSGRVLRDLDYVRAGERIHLPL